MVVIHDDSSEKQPLGRKLPKSDAAVNKPYQNEIICWHNLIRYSFDFCIFRYFRGVSKIKSEMIMSKLRIGSSSWWVVPFWWVPFFGIRIKWFDGFGCFVFTDFIYKISKRRFVERWNASNNRYKFWTRNHLNFSLKRTPENFCVIWVRALILPDFIFLLLTLWWHNISTGSLFGNSFIINFSNGDG